MSPPVPPLPLRSAVLALCFAGTVTRAQPLDTPSPESRPSGAAGARPPIETQVDWSTTARSAVRTGANRPGDSGAAVATISLQARVPLAPPRWVMPVGLVSQNLHFNGMPGVPLPEAAHTLSLNIGLGYRPSEKWMFMMRASPTLYRTDDITGDALGWSGGFSALWRRDPARTILLGVMVNPDGDLPIVPMVGMNWTIDPQWALSLMIPRPRLTYRLGSRWTLHVGANLAGATIRTSRDFGSRRGEPRYDSELASYRDVRAGVGATCRIGERFSLEVEAGRSFSRRLEYTDLEETIKFSPSAYFRAGLRWGF